MSAAVGYPGSHEGSEQYDDEQFEDDFETESVSSDASAHSGGSAKAASAKKASSPSAASSSKSSSAMPWERASNTHSSRSASAEERKDGAAFAETPPDKRADAAATSPSSKASSHSPSCHSSAKAPSASHHSASDHRDAARAANEDNPSASTASSAASAKEKVSSAKQSVASAVPKVPLSPQSYRSSSPSTVPSSSSSSSRASSPAPAPAPHGHAQDADQHQQAAPRAAPADAASKAAGESYESAAASSSRAASHRSHPTKRSSTARSARPSVQHGTSARRRSGLAAVEPAEVPRTAEELADMQRENDRLREEIYQRQRDLYHATLSANKAETRRAMSRRETAAQHVREAVLLERAQQMMRREQKELLQQKALLQESVQTHKRGLKYITLVEEAKEDLDALKEEHRDLCLEMRCNEKLLVMNADVMESGQGAKQLHEEMRSRNALLERQAGHALRDADDMERQRNALRERVEVLQERVDKRRNTTSSAGYSEVQNLREENRERTRQVRDLKARVERLRAAVGGGSRHASTTGGGDETGKAGRRGTAHPPLPTSKYDAEKEYLSERVAFMRRELAQLMAGATNRPAPDAHEEPGAPATAKSPMASRHISGGSSSAAADRYEAAASGHDGEKGDSEAPSRYPTEPPPSHPPGTAGTSDVALWLDNEAASAHPTHTAAGASSPASRNLDGGDIDGAAGGSRASLPAASSSRHSAAAAMPGTPSTHTDEHAHPIEAVEEASASPAWLDEEPEPEDAREDGGGVVGSSGHSSHNSHQPGGSAEDTAGAAVASLHAESEGDFEEESVTDDTEEPEEEDEEEVVEEMLDDDEGEHDARVGRTDDAAAAATADEDDTPDWLKF